MPPPRRPARREASSPKWPSARSACSPRAGTTRSGWWTRLWVFRLPRRAVAIAGVEREIAVLPRLAPFLPLPIPEPVLRRPPRRGGFPWPFFGCRVPARPGGPRRRPHRSRPPWSCATAGSVPAPRLHRHDLAGRFDELPADPNRRGDMRLRVPGCLGAPAGGRAVGPVAAAERAPAMARRGAGAARRRCSRPSSMGTCTPATSWSTSTTRSPPPSSTGGTSAARTPPSTWPLLVERAPSETHAASSSPRTARSARSRLLRARVLALFLGAALAAVRPSRAADRTSSATRSAASTAPAASDRLERLCGTPHD